MRTFLPVYEPWLTTAERDALLESFDSGWISWAGPFVERAERALEGFLGVDRAHVVSSGTTALHLALRALDVGPGDVVAVPETTYIASAFAVSYVGAKPVFIDAEERSWNMDLGALERLCESTQVRAVLVVHLYGNPLDMAALEALRAKYGFVVVEDACESFGATFQGVQTGGIGDIGCFSFYGNKTLTTGEGGAVVTNRSDLADRVYLLRGQAMDPDKRFWHTDIGYNYRMTGLQGAMLASQIDRFDEVWERKQQVARWYQERLADVEGVSFQETHPDAVNAWWMVSVTTPVQGEVMARHLRERGIDSRPVFYPISDMPPYQECETVSVLAPGGEPNVSRRLGGFGLSLPSFPLLGEEEVERVCAAVQEGVVLWG